MPKVYTQSLGTLQIQITDHSEEVLAALRNAIERGMGAIGDSAVEYAQQNITALGAVVTGNLRGNIFRRLEDDNHTVVIGTPVEYGKYVEEGHRQEPGRYVPALGKRLKAAYVPPKPFLKPAIADHLSEYRELLKESLENA